MEFRVRHVPPLRFLLLLLWSLMLIEQIVSQAASESPCVLATENLQTCVEDKILAPVHQSDGGEASGPDDVETACQDEIDAHEEHCGDVTGSNNGTDPSVPDGPIFPTMLCMVQFANWTVCAVGENLENLAKCALPCQVGGGWQIDYKCDNYTDVWCVREEFCNCEECRTLYDKYKACMERFPLSCKAPESCPTPAPSSSTRNGFGAFFVGMMGAFVVMGTTVAM